MIYQHDDNGLDRVEEIYLTQSQYICWRSADTPRIDIFDTREGRVVLKDLYPAREPKQEPSILLSLGPLAEAVLGPEWKKRSETQSVEPPPPVPVRKLERPADAEWTFFFHCCLVAGVHDDGTVVGRFNLWGSPEPETRITPDGTLIFHNKPAREQELIDGTAERIAGHFQRALQAWVKREKGRKMPPGIRKLTNCITGAKAASTQAGGWAQRW